ncbi:MAG TPA: hypothetical protein VMY59_08125 [Candidatus Thermoplasmatota archaeon]|nr:hypothetical protein [Candidatus Thermoplasmatota archaeon]
MKKSTKSLKPPVDFVGENKNLYHNVHWKEVLDEIYNRVPNAFGPGKFKHEKQNPIAKKLKITDQEFYDNVMFLNQLKLIEIRNEGQWTNMYPTTKGFDVALQNEKMKIELKKHRGIMTLTAIIAFTAMFSFINATGDYNSINVVILYIIGISLISLVVVLKKIKL